MKIAQVAPLIERVPPKAYGGTERIVHYLTEELHRSGHDVTLFASGDSVTEARHIAVVNESLRKSTVHRDPVYWHQIQLARVAEMADEFDIIHFHTDLSHFNVMRYLDTPHVTTLHGRLNLPDLDAVFGEFHDAPIVSISNSQRQPISNASWVGTVYNGTPAANYTFRQTAGDYFAFLGRFSPEKGPLRAIEIAKALETPLRMAAKIDAVDVEYFHDVIEPHLKHPLIEYIGEVDERGKDELLSHARATLFPIDWPEPFGLVMTESMACGTPVIAFRNGSVDEVMKDGVSGFIVDTLDQAIEAAARVDEIDRRKCRLYFQDRFTVEKMALGYLEVYENLVEPRQIPVNRRPPIIRAPLPKADVQDVQSR